MGRLYKNNFTKTITLSNGTPLMFRPINSGDELLWLKFLRSCKSESIYYRFGYIFHWEDLIVATRFCSNDSDNEMAIAVEFDDNLTKKFVGIGRLAADFDHYTAKYAILIADTWQNKGLGKLLTDYCIQIAKEWGIKQIKAQTTLQNHKIINLLKIQNFDIIVDPVFNNVEAIKTLTT